MEAPPGPHQGLTAPAAQTPEAAGSLADALTKITYPRRGAVGEGCASGRTDAVEPSRIIRPLRVVETGPTISKSLRADPRPSRMSKVCASLHCDRGVRGPGNPETEPIGL